jgi:hypothetical protein
VEYDFPTDEHIVCRIHSPFVRTESKETETKLEVKGRAEKVLAVEMQGRKITGGY